MTDTPDTIHRIHPDLRPLAVPIDELNEDPANANSHNDASLAGIAASFIRFGQRKNIVVRREGMVIEAGNGTLAALKAAGWTHLACSVCDDDEDTAKAYALADNNRRSTWDMNQLAQNVGELLAADYDLTGLWADDELKVLADRTWVQPSIGIIATEDDDQPAPDSEPADTVAELQADPGDEPEDVIPEPPAEPVTKFGDVIELGPHTLHCADCMDVLRSLPANSVDAIVTDPSYGLSPDGKARTWDDIEALRAAGKHTPKAGFLGKEWDAGVPGITWARECRRVLKPGGHIVAFSATRTVHRLTCALEDAGFEIRDQIGWIQWQGQPHSLDVSKAIDRQKFNHDEILEVTAWVREARDAAGLKNADIDNAFGFVGMSGHWTSKTSQPSVPTLEQVPTLFKVLGVECPPPRIQKLLLDLNASKGEPGPNWWKRDVVGTYAGDAGGFVGLRKGTPGGDITTAATENAKKWEGWGTGLKGALEPAVLARKPLSESTVAFNVLKWGTGALNIDACKHPANDPAWPGPWTNSDPKWPANIYHCKKPAAREKRAGCDDVEAAHETVKPVGLIAQLVKLITPPGGHLVEPFGGSGTILPAVARVDPTIHVTLAELSPKYMDIIRARGEHSLLPPPRRVPARPGDKTQARRRIQTRQDSGAIDPPGDLPCHDCGDTTCESPHEYDHYLGYGEDKPDDQEHVAMCHETVQAVCASCHHKREAARVAAASQPGPAARAWRSA